MTYTYNLTEEIARWAFEIRCKDTKDWYIAFTNPTAGPWKSMKCLDKNNKEQEIYRFGSKEERPDIVLINDKLEIIIIFEAKDSLPKLCETTQCQKSVKVVHDITKFFKTCTSDYFGEKRKAYKVFLGLLWGCEDNNTARQIQELNDLYYQEILKYDNINKSAIISIITHKTGNQLDCYLDIKNYNNFCTNEIKDNMIKTLNLKPLE